MVISYIVKPVDAILEQGVDWKLSTILLGCLLFAFPLRAQTPAPPLPPPAAEENVPPELPPEALNQLLSPIALYPDALVALILPASTVPSDLVLAARYLSSNGDPGADRKPVVGRQCQVACTLSGRCKMDGSESRVDDTSR